MVAGITNQVALQGHHVQVVVDVVGDFKTVGKGGRLVAALGHTDGHVEVAKSRRRPHTIIIAVVRVVGIVGLKRDFLTVNTCFNAGELDDFSMLDIGRDNNHDWMDFI